MIAAVVVGAFTVRNILSQPASQGLALAFDLAWLGIVYGCRRSTKSRPALQTVMPERKRYGRFI